MPNVPELKAGAAQSASGCLGCVAMMLVCVIIAGLVTLCLKLLLRVIIASWSLV